MKQSVWLQEKTWKDVEGHVKKNDIIIVPVGSTEEPGLAGPLGLDSYVSISLAEDAGMQTGTLVAPPLWYGDSSHHLGFPGTISLSTKTLMAVIGDMSRSLAGGGFRKILFINGHKSANLPALLSATKELHENELPNVFFAVADPMKIARGIAGKLKSAREHHAGEREISQVWYKYPHLIKTEFLKDEHVPFSKLFSGFFHGDLFGAAGDTIDIPWNSREQREFAPTGSLSDSSDASPDKGRQYHEYMVAVLVRFIAWLKAYDGPIGNSGQFASKKYSKRVRE